MRDNIEVISHTKFVDIVKQHASRLRSILYGTVTDGCWMRIPRAISHATRGQLQYISLLFACMPDRFSKYADLNYYDHHGIHPHFGCVTEFGEDNGDRPSAKMNEAMGMAPNQLERRI